MIQYNIGCTTWGHPIVWTRSTPSGVWIAAVEQDPDKLDPSLICNLASWQFAKKLKQIVRVGGWVHSVHNNMGWHQVTRVDPWCAQYKMFLGNEYVPYIYCTAYADESKDNLVFSDTVEIPDRLMWNLHGFVIW